VFHVGHHHPARNAETLEVETCFHAYEPRNLSQFFGLPPSQLIGRCVISEKKKESGENSSVYFDRYGGRSTPLPHI
jgi:hypothetical protein